MLIALDSNSIDNLLDRLNKSLDLTNKAQNCHHKEFEYPADICTKLNQNVNEKEKASCRTCLICHVEHDISSNHPVEKELRIYLGK